MSALRCHCGHSALDCVCVPPLDLLRDPPGDPSPEECDALDRVRERLTTRGRIDADEWTLTADDPRRCKRCQRVRCECYVTDAAQARASLPDVVRK